MHQQLLGPLHVFLGAHGHALLLAAASGVLASWKGRSTWGLSPLAERVLTAAEGGREGQCQDSTGSGVWTQASAPHSGSKPGAWHHPSLAAGEGEPPCPDADRPEQGHDCLALGSLQPCPAPYSSMHLPGSCAVLCIPGRPPLCVGLLRGRHVVRRQLVQVIQGPAGVLVLPEKGTQSHPRAPARLLGELPGIPRAPPTSCTLASFWVRTYLSTQRMVDMSACSLVMARSHCVSPSPVAWHSTPRKRRVLSIRCTTLLFSARGGRDC